MAWRTRGAASARLADSASARALMYSAVRLRLGTPFLLNVGRHGFVGEPWLVCLPRIIRFQGPACCCTPSRRSVSRTWGLTQHDQQHARRTCSFEPRAIAEQSDVQCQAAGADRQAGARRFAMTAGIV